jgi:hypothetical protein
MATLDSARTTDDSANDHVADHNVLATAFNAQSRLLGVEDFFLGTGSAATSLLNSIAPVWLLDAASSEGVIATVEFPADWGNFHVDLIWAPTASAAGNVRLQVQGTTFGDGEAVPAYTTLGTVTAANPGTVNVVEVTRLVTSQAVIAGETQLLQILRLGADGADTFASDIGLIGVRLTKAA